LLLPAWEANRDPDTADCAHAQGDAAAMEGRQVLYDGQADAGPGHGPVEPCAVRHDLFHPVLRYARAIIVDRQ
jgi:hypothetical protein